MLSSRHVGLSTFETWCMSCPDRRTKPSPRTHIHVLGRRNERLGATVKLTRHRCMKPDGGSLGFQRTRVAQLRFPRLSCPARPLGRPSVHHARDDCGKQGANDQPGANDHVNRITKNIEILSVIAPTSQVVWMSCWHQQEPCSHHCGARFVGLPPL